MAYLFCDSYKLGLNIVAIQKICSEQNLKLTVVTKAVCSRPDIVQFLIQNAVHSIADTNISNFEQNLFAPVSKILLRMKITDIPFVTGCEHPVSYIYVSDSGILTALQEESFVPFVILPIEVGDHRDGIELNELSHILKQYKRLPIAGVSANFSCLSHRLPDKQSLEILVHAGEEYEQITGRKAIVSAGGSVLWDYIRYGYLPEQITDVRLGEAVFLGYDSVRDRALPGLRQDVWYLLAETVETRLIERLFKKQIQRCVLDFGSLAAPEVHLQKCNPDVMFCGQTFDFTVVEISETEQSPGNLLFLGVNYTVLSYSSLNPYIQKMDLAW